MAEYMIKDEGKAFVQALNEVSYNTAKEEVQSIRALAGKAVASVEVLSKDYATPTGCAVYSVSSNATVFLEVKGRVDIDAEIKKGKEKMKKAADGAEKQRKILHAPDFEEKVSGAVQAAERQKLEDFLTEQRNRGLSIQQFERLKLEW